MDKFIVKEENSKLFTTEFVNWLLVLASMDHHQFHHIVALIEKLNKLKKSDLIDIIICAKVPDTLKISECGKKK